MRPPLMWLAEEPSPSNIMSTLPAIRSCSAGPAAVVDEQLLAGLLGELRRKRPCEGIGAAAGRERHDHHHRPCRPGALRERGGGDGGQRARAQQVAPEQSRILHLTLLNVV